MRKESIESLFKRCESGIRKIETEYNDSLYKREVGNDLRIDTKELLEHLRSALDYLAHDIREKYCSSSDPKGRFYFPILPGEPEFKSRAKEWYPQLETAAPDLWSYLESVQPYHEDYRWLGNFNRVTASNKHEDLVAQIRTESQRVNVTFQAGGVSWDPAAVRFGPGVFIGGVPVDPSTQMPVPDPSQRVERTVWVDFQFEGVNTSAFGLMRRSLEGISKIAKDLEKWL